VKPKILRCGNHWAVDWWSGRTQDLPAWWCFNTWGEALERALKCAAWLEKHGTNIGTRLGANSGASVRR
jgi:hypothetical protein